MYLRDYSWAAGGFYPTDPRKAEDQIARCMEGAIPALDEFSRLVGAVVPHAGWVFSGPTAGKTLKALSQRSKPKLAICFGAVHVHGARKAVILKDGEWRTPLGNLPIAGEIAELIIDELKDMITVSEHQHEEEHSIEVVAPFVKKCFPDVSMVPIMVPPGKDAPEVGRKIGEILSGRTDAIVIGSTDMTHYGSRFGFAPVGFGAKAVEWVRNVNDKKLVDIMLDMRADEVVSEASRSMNACGPGAIAATIAACAQMGATKGRLIEYTTSYDVAPREGADTFVGYAGVVFG